MEIQEAIRDTADQQVKADPMGDERLTRMAQGGSQWAFTELCRRHSKRTYQVIYRITCNGEDAEDALQDSFLNAFRNLGKFDGRAGFATWLTRIGINCALMLLRKRRIRRESSTIPFEDTFEMPMEALRSPNPEQSYLAAERSRRFSRAVDGLPHKLRETVLMRQVEGRSVKEIADSVGISVPAAKSRLTRAKAELRRSLR